MKPGRALLAAPKVFVLYVCDENDTIIGTYFRGIRDGRTPVLEDFDAGRYDPDFTYEIVEYVRS